MRTLFLLIFTIIMSLSLVITDAQAKRFGGGRSFGISRPVSSFSRPQTNQFANNNAFGNSIKNNANRWLGPLAGLALGGILATLFMGHGMTSGILSWLVIGGIALMIITALRNRKQPSMQAANNYHAYHEQTASPMHSGYSSFANSNHTYSDFNNDEFLRDSKAKFLRLQAAYDQKNLSDIREFCAPEVCAEIQLQFQERGNAANQTEVVTLNAELVDVKTEAKTVASIQFSGLIREDGHQVAASFNEIWHFIKDGDRWLVAGIQQN